MLRWASRNWLSKENTCRERPSPDSIPYGVHGFVHTIDSVPLPDLLLWGVAAAALGLLALAGGNRPTGLRRHILCGGAVAVALVAPALWGLASTSTERLGMSLSPYLKILKESQMEGTTTLHSTFRRIREGERLADGSFATDDTSPRWVLAAYYMPIQLPGLYRIVTHGVTVGGNQTAYVSHHRTLPAQQTWGERLRFPVHAGEDSTHRFDYYHDRLQLGYLHFVYSGTGELRIGETTQVFHARRLPLRLEEAARFDFRNASAPLEAFEDFPQGRYLARFRLTGGALSTPTQRLPAPVKMAVVVTDAANVPFERLRSWYDSPRRMYDITAQADEVQPQREALAVPWWASVPIVGDNSYELSFLVRQPGRVWFLFQYDGPADLALEEIVVYRQHLDM